MDIKVITKEYALSYVIDNVPFYVDDDGDLTSNIHKAARMDFKTAKRIQAVYLAEDIDMNCVEVQTEGKVTI